DTQLYKKYQQGFKVNELIPVNVLGFQTHRDKFAIDFDRASVHERIAEMRSIELSDEEFSRKHILGNWKLKEARKQLRANAAWEKDLIKCAYRPLNFRDCYYSEIV
ncbi:type ISP restriction/modification enzyme, partial [Arthrospira platensis SPKY1]|nr:type ISP restriction/modification enzyme [Arthrospira platensis SPKY1]